MYGSGVKNPRKKSIKVRVIKNMVQPFKFFGLFTRFQMGILIIITGILIVLFSVWLHKMYPKEEYKLAKAMKREGKTAFQNRLFIAMYIRTQNGIILGCFIIIFGLIICFCELFNINIY